MEIAFEQIEQEFKQTFGYIKGDIAKILEEDLRLHYTIALLVCCACEMLTWHRNLWDHQAFDVFTSLLPKTEPFQTAGQTLWEALRNGLAHNFRPATISIGNEEWRCTISSQDGPYIRVTEGPPHWIHLNIRPFSSRVISQIDAYEQELRASANARLSFYEKSRTYIKTIPPDATRIADALRSLLGETHH